MYMLNAPVGKLLVAQKFCLANPVKASSKHSETVLSILRANKLNNGNDKLGMPGRYDDL